MSYVFRAELAQPVGLLPEQAGLTFKQQPVGEEPTEMPARSRDGGPGSVTSPLLSPSPQVDRGVHSEIFHFYLL